MIIWIKPHVIHVMKTDTIIGIGYLKVPVFGGQGQPVNVHLAVHKIVCEELRRSSLIGVFMENKLWKTYVITARGDV